MNSANRLRDEYNKMVDLINKQLKRLEKADPDAVSIGRYRNYFQKVTSNRPNYRTMQKMYSSAKRLLDSGELSLVSSERSKASGIQTFHRMGHTWVNKRNYNALIAFLDDARSRGLGSLYSSEQLAAAYYEINNKGLSKSDIQKNIDKWSKQIKRDGEGKTIEVTNPKKLKVTKYGNKGK